MRTSFKLSALVVATLVGGSQLISGCASEEPAARSAEQNVLGKPRRPAPDAMDAAENYELWSAYCIGDDEMTERPIPNYDHPDVMQAAVNLSQVASHSFALYGDINGHHKTAVPEAYADTVSKMAHEFLGYLCGEFRDRASMVQAKVDWVATMNYLDDEEGDAYDPAGDPWQQMKAADYRPYLRVSESLFAAKRSKLEEEGRRYTQVGEIQADTPVPPQTICETKYMFAEYVKAGEQFDGYDAFMDGYADFREASCTLPDDEDYYYDFRGDSNIKPNSPESNGMIWPARTIAKQCDSRASADNYREVREQSSMSAAICQRYFKYPFTSRWNAARAGLATWVLVDPNGEGLDSNSQFTVFPRNSEDNDYLFGDKGPYRAQNSQGEPVVLLDGYNWRWGAFGLPEMHDNDKETIQRILQLAVDRHTDWYNSGYDDEMDYKAYKRAKAYSPFVASSYEMSESDSFVTPGLTVPVIDPSSREFKHWMFVFRVHKDNWYTPDNVNAEDAPLPNFDRVWLDETSFGNTSLANSEKAWDRLGTALEGELDTLLYLHNIPSGH